jgi:hypothetical protein
MRVAGGVALLGLLTVAAVRQCLTLRAASLALVNWQLLVLPAALLGADDLLSAMHLPVGALLPLFQPTALLAAASLTVWNEFAPRGRSAAAGVAVTQRWLLRFVTAAALAAALALPSFTWPDVALAAAAFAVVIFCELRTACRAQDVDRAWAALLIAFTAAGYFVAAGVVPFGSGMSLFVPLVASLILAAAAHVARRRPTTALLAGPFAQVASALPMLTVVAGVCRHLLGVPPRWPAVTSLAMLLAGGYYFWCGLENRRPGLLVLSATILNLSLAILWREMHLTDPQVYMIPLGTSVLALVEFLRKEIPAERRDPLRYFGAILILVSPTFHIVGGSWLHLLTLMLASVAVLLVSIGLRVRALMYAGAAFLAADLAAMVVRGSIDHPGLLWAAGLVVGAAVVGLGAFAENHREKLLQRLRGMSAALQSWD